MAEITVLESSRLNRNQKYIMEVKAILSHIQEVAPDSKYVNELEKISNSDEDWISKNEKSMEVYNKYLEEVSYLSDLSNKVENISGVARIIKTFPTYVKEYELINDSYQTSRGDSNQTSRGDSYQKSRGNYYLKIIGDSYQTSRADSYQKITADSYLISIAGSFQKITADYYQKFFKKKGKRKKINLCDYVDDDFPVNNDHKVKECYDSYERNINHPFNNQDSQTPFNNYW